MRICQWTLLSAALLVGGAASAAGFRVGVTRQVPGEVIRGAALERDGRALLTWGDRLRRWSLPALQSEQLAQSSFGEGGCLWDVNRDGQGI